MIVTVRLHATLRRKTAEGFVDRLDVELPADANLRMLLQKLDLAANYESLMVLVNRQYARLEKPLNEGDDVRLFPAISGGKPSKQFF